MVKWVHKNRIKCLFQGIGITIARERRHTLEFLETVLRDLQEKTDKDGMYVKDIQIIKDRLTKFHLHRLQQKRKISKVKNILYDEKYSLYELGKEIKHKKVT